MQSNGLGGAASHLICGHHDAHHQLEQRLADFTGRSAALFFSTGYMANMGVISALAGRGDTVFSDRLNHASIIDGCILSRARVRRYPHGDMRSLEDMLSKTDGHKLVVTDGVFSMDGDIAPLALRALSLHARGRPPGLAASALRRLRAHPWPGNVRELENAIERAVILSDGTEVTADLLAIDHESPTPVRPALSGRPAPAPAAPEEPDSSTLEDYFVRFVLDHEDHMTETEIAQRLGISRKSLWERRQRLDIPRKRTRNRGPRSTRSAATGSGGESR
jgi:hypothetical protein